MKALFLLSGIGMILAGVLAYLIWNRKHKTDFTYYLLGAACWLAAITLKFSFAIAFNKKIKAAFNLILPKTAASISFYAYIGILTGVFECGMVLLFLYLIKSIQKQTFNQAVAFGIGFGGIESILLGLQSLITITIIIFFPQILPPDTPYPFSISKLWIIPAPIIERISTIFIHIFSTVLIVYAFLTKKNRWFWGSFTYKTLVDAFAAWVAMTDLGETAIGLYLVEFEIAVFGLFGFIMLKILKEKWPETESEE